MNPLAIAIEPSANEPSADNGQGFTPRIRRLPRRDGTLAESGRVRTLTWKRAIKIVLAIVLVAALYYSVDARAVLAVLAGLNGWLLAAGLLLFIPQTLLSAWRWQTLVAPLCQIGLGQAVRHTLAASALNLVVPSKLGDLSKSAMLPIEGTRRRTAATARAVVEKVADVTALSVLLLLGAARADAIVLCGILGTVAGVNGVLAWCNREAAQTSAKATGQSRSLCRLTAAAHLIGSSLLLWTLHLLQIHCFLWAAGVQVSWQVAMARVPVAIFAGLLPVSFCGFGTRDAALVWLFADVAPAATMAAVGTLTALRYLVPGAAGIFCVGGVWRRSDEVVVVSHSA